MSLRDTANEYIPAWEKSICALNELPNFILKHICESNATSPFLPGFQACIPVEDRTAVLGSDPLQGKTFSDLYGTRKMPTFRFNFLS